MNRSIYLITGLIFMVYYTILTLSKGRVIFSEFFHLVGIVFLLYGVFYKILKGNNYFLRFIKVVEMLIFIGVIIFILAEGFMITTSIERDKSSSDYLIVLGSEFRGEGFKERLDTTIEYLSSYGKEENIIVSGGVGLTARLSEALVMKKFLVEGGIEEHRIIVEDKSRNIYENLKYSKDIIEKYSNNKVSNYKIKVITSNYHGLRAKMLAKRLGYEDITLYTSKTNYILAPNYFVREFFALIKSFIFDR
ncbi:YdcF family protein [Clostridium sp.]|uniref:YdcF family protein n=1 Tax=Clostridium sp. TaxID=1506 RepID=UPI003464DD18